MRIETFMGRYSFLSNFDKSPIVYEGRMYPTAEHLFQSFKVVSYLDKEEIRQTRSPAEAKGLGRKVKMDTELWNKKRIRYMRITLLLKFTQHPNLLKELIRTGDAEIIEGNMWGDLYWGVNLETGEGENSLGKLLMEIRELLKIEIFYEDKFEGLNRNTSPITDDQH